MSDEFISNLKLEQASAQYEIMAEDELLYKVRVGCICAFVRTWLAGSLGQEFPIGDDRS